MVRAVATLNILVIRTKKLDGRLFFMKLCSVS